MEIEFLSREVFFDEHNEIDVLKTVSYIVNNHNAVYSGLEDEECQLAQQGKELVLVYFDSGIADTHLELDRVRVKKMLDGWYELVFTD